MCGRVIITSVLIRRERDGRAGERVWFVCFSKVGAGVDIWSGKTET
jgi:hypothetical protein